MSLMARTGGCRNVAPRPSTELRGHGHGKPDNDREAAACAAAAAALAAGSLVYARVHSSFMEHRYLDHAAYGRKALEVEARIRSTSRRILGDLDLEVDVTVDYSVRDSGCGRTPGREAASGRHSVAGIICILRLMLYSC